MIPILFRAKPEQRKEDHAMPDTPDRILRLNAVLDRTGLSRSTLYRKMQRGTFPRNVQISTRCAGWRESAINDWLRNPVFYEARSGPQG
jgi:prophage regulatory protein